MPGAKVPTELTESFQPVYGAAVTVRPLRPEDADIETAFVAGLSPETRANRLLGGAIKPTREYIERLTKVDYTRDMALAATVMLEWQETLIGVARYALDADRRACEFALVIADAWQGRGIGGRMLAKLLAIASARGIPRMYGDTLAVNRAMLALGKASGFRLVRHPDEAHLTRMVRDLH